MGDFWIIVNNLDGTPGVYILKPEEVKKMAHKGEKDGRISYWLQPKSYMAKEFENRWDRIKNDVQQISVHALRREIEVRRAEIARGKVLSHKEIWQDI